MQNRKSKFVNRKSLCGKICNKLGVKCATEEITNGDMYAINLHFTLF